MKTSFKYLIVAFALVTTFAFTANAGVKDTKKASTIQTGVYINKDGKINLSVDNLDTRSNTTILVKNESGNVVYKEVVERGNAKFGRILNVEELAAGTYEIEVSSNNDTLIKSFQVSQPQAERIVLVE
jgi:outer membrane lipoprotein-sorting protein